MTSDDSKQTEADQPNPPVPETDDGETSMQSDAGVSDNELVNALDSPELLESVAKESSRGIAKRPQDSSRESSSERKTGRTKRKRTRPPRSRAARITISFVQIVVVTYISLLIALVCMETRLVYPGAYFGDANDTQNYPSGDASGIEPVDYSSEDGTQLRGRLVERDNASECLIFFHGNGSKARWLDPWANILSNAFDANVLLAEYRGYEDEATPSESAVLADCQAAREYLCNRYQCEPSDVILYGRSLGGGCAVAMASQGGAKALVLERTFDRLVDVAGEKYPYVPVSMLMRNRYDSIAKLTAYDGPLVMLHGNTDTLIPIENARQLYASAGCDAKQWIEVPGLGHNDPLASTDLQQIVQAVNQLTSKAPASNEPGSDASLPSPAANVPTSGSDAPE